MRLPSHPFRSRRARAFTLVELLIVITIIIVLAAVVFSVTQGIRRSAVKVADMNNLRSLSNAAMASGSDNTGKLPVLHAGADGPSTPNSLPYILVGRDTLESYGIYKESCYIPRKGVEGGGPDYKWWEKFDRDKKTQIHYNYFANDATPESEPWFSGTLVAPDETEYRGAMKYEDIIKDKDKAFPSRLTDDSWYQILWSGISVDLQGGEHIAALVDKGKPLGVNVMFLDGHAEWVDKSKMKLRYTSSGSKIYW